MRDCMDGWRYRVSLIVTDKLNLITSIGLALGAVFGLAGTMVTQPHLQQVFWVIDSSGLVMATSLMVAGSNPSRPTTRQPGSDP